ncbi:MAG TPA: VWA domain-containing protein [Anaerolineales bacterium]|nr:VWA domain-containing protein [Anaerolineales bacterium]
MRRQNRILALLLVLAVSLWPFAAVRAQGREEPQLRITQVDNSRFPNVTVYVSATNAAGEPVGIDPSLIQLYENGQLIELADVKGGGDVASGESVPVTTMLVIDISGSMDKNDKLVAAKEAAKSYVNQMRSGDQAGVIAYDTQVYTVQPVTSDTAALTAAIDGLKTGSDTAMYNALVEAQKALESLSGRKAIIVLTDGLDNKSQFTADDVIAGIGESGLTISAIGFGDVGVTGQAGLNEAGLRSLVERAGGIYGFATDSEALKGLYQKQSRALQSEYQLIFVSPFALRDGINRGLTVSLANSTVSTEGQYNPGGVLPEVASRSWGTFVVILLVLLFLLFLPMLISVGSRALNNDPKRKLAGNRAINRVSSQPPARGRIKLK